MGKKLTKKKKMVLIIVIAVVLVIGLGVGAILIFDPFGNKDELIKDAKKKVVKEEEPVVQIVDLESKSRPYAVMVNNIGVARTVQSGLNKAYMVYEIVAEGGITRYLALFRDVEDVEIGSVRSSRHYYLDYALENDAIYVHWGWSPQAQEDIGTLGINNINGLTYEGTYFYRKSGLNVAYEHTGFTTAELIKAGAEHLGYRLETDTPLLLNYSAKSVDLTKYNPSVATNVTLVYSNYTTNNYEYDETNKVYKRYVSGEQQIDHETEEPLTVKNIIAYQVENYSIAGDYKGRQMLNNIGTGSGYYITEGKAVPIKWSKADRASQTVYTYEDGTEITVNDGNTWIQIVPTDGAIELG